MEVLPPHFKQLIEELNEAGFVNYLRNLTGISGLIPDMSLEGGGLHQTERGGFLNVHADFTVHPHKRNWRRRVNVLIYLNEDWQEEYGGHLEFWSRDMKQCQQKFSPILNRCVIFNTDQDSFHGLPDPIQCQEQMTRKSIALYYYTEEKTSPLKRSTNYQARPGEGLNKLWVFLDKKAIALYSQIKGLLGIDDELASRVLNFLHRKK